MNERRFGLGTVLYVFSQNLSKVLLLKLTKSKRNKFGVDWGNVGGKINIGETSLENCIRESKEEIGINFKPDDLRLLYVKEIPNFFNKIHAVQFVYGTTLNEQMPLVIGRELESYQWFDLDNLPERTLDAKEEFYKAARLLNKGHLKNSN